MFIIVFYLFSFAYITLQVTLHPQIESKSILFPLKH